VKVLLTFIVCSLFLTVASIATASVKVPSPHERNIQTRQMYACNHRPAAWTKAELQCVVRIGFGSQASNAMGVVACESVWTPRAVSPTGDYGLFQINRTWNAEGWRLGANIFDPVWNTRIAKYFYLTRGWGDWTCGRMLGIA
jgi:hypothetical protein